MRTLHKQTDVSSDIEDTFEFFSDAANLITITPDDFAVKILNDKPIEMKEGAVIKLKMKLFKFFSISWETKIVEWDPPNGFTDIQPTGPFSYWKHTHRFKRIRGGTRIIDIVEYEVPGWIFSPIINKLTVRPQLESLFTYRQNKYRETFGEVTIEERVYE